MISADVNFNRGIDAAEFAKAAATRFAALDRNHDGALTRGELPSGRRGDLAQRIGRTRLARSGASRTLIRTSEPPAPCRDHGMGRAVDQAKA